MAKKLSELPVGAKVKDAETMYNGVPIIWQIGGHNHYAAGQTVLVSKDIITLKAFDAIEASNTDSYRKSYGNNRYAYSNLRQWLNSAATSWYAAQHSADAPPNNANVWSNYNEYDAKAGFLTNFSENMRNALVPTTLTVAKNTVTDGGGSESASDKVFLLSNTEVGLTNENSITGDKRLALFTTADSSRLAYPTAAAVSESDYTNSAFGVSKAWHYWLRSPFTSTSHKAYSVNVVGASFNNFTYYGHYGVRPALNLPSGILVSDSVDSDGAYVIIEFKTAETRYLFALKNNAYTIASGVLKELGTITTTNASTLFRSGVEAITKEHCVLAGQQLGKAKIMRMLV